MNEREADTALYAMRDLIASHIACEKECQTSPTGCGCALTAARAVLSVPAQGVGHCGEPVMWVCLVDDPIAEEKRIRAWTSKRERADRFIAAEGLDMQPLYASPAQSSWRPIETAPKDGTSILVTMAGGSDGPYYVLFWNDNYFESLESGEGPNMGHLTHWQPLPIPPASSALPSTDREGK